MPHQVPETAAGQPQDTKRKKYMGKNKELFGKGMEVTETPYEDED